MLSKTTFALMAACSMALATAAKEYRNVLFICVDDLRPVMGCYGGAAQTPVMDHFAEKAAVFQRHYVQWPVCGPSRASMLGGLRPDSTGIYVIRDAVKIAERPDTHPVLPLYFRNHGYTTLSFGKIYHHNKKLGPEFGWSEPSWEPKSHWSAYVHVKPQPGWRLVGPAYEIYEGPDTLHNDYKTADQVINALKRCQDKPFFIAAGFCKPHLPFVAPKKYWDLYEDQPVERVEPTELPKGAADYTYNWTELVTYSDPEGNYYSPERGPDETEALKMIRAYYASVSFIDHQIGRLLNELDNLGLAETTAVVVWGDHGFHLGDHARWAKHTQFEQAMRSPLMIYIPQMNQAHGAVLALAESVDIYPTLCDYAGLEKPGFLDGKSLLPVLSGKGPGSPAAFSQISPLRKNAHWMAYSVRTDRFRYVEWRDTAENNRLASRELYDHQNDPDETVNVVDQATFSTILKEHAARVLDAYTSLQK